MELKVWGKTFLSIYTHLEKVTYAIDKIVLTTGLNAKLDAQKGAKKMIELTNKKIKLINLKLFIEKALNSIDKDYTKLLMLKYVDNVKSEDIAKIFCISNRTFFRKSNAALKSFELSLKRLGKTHKSLLNEYKNENWIMDIFNKFLEEEVKQLKSAKQKSSLKVVNTKKIAETAYKNYKKIDYSQAYEFV